MTRVARRNRDEVPSGRKYAPADDDEAEEEDFDDEEDETPPRRSRRTGSTSDRAARNRRAFDDGAEEGRRRPAGRKTRQTSGGGWNALANAKSEGGYSENLKVGKDDIIIKFLEPEPYAVFRQHWIQEVKASKKSYYCPEDDGCPLCDIGDRPRHQVYFNVLDLSNPEKPTVKTWSMGKRLAEKIHGLSEKPRTSPIDRPDLYWAVSKSGEGTSTEYNLQPVKGADLYEWFDVDAEVEPLSEDELAEYIEKCQTEDDVYQDSLEVLEKVAEEIS
ncbi:hypothetical protein [Nonomuraea typhae]|uniref:Bacteriophage T4 Gp32 single-stranded DNA-binding domain-containing protein n=1 Tax=Nonomuraea typhae TaxID=2603600 RepID=A0ABW7YJU8_9ACTN